VRAIHDTTVCSTIQRERERERESESESERENARQPFANGILIKATFAHEPKFRSNYSTELNKLDIESI
jgi:hypothetical protein